MPALELGDGTILTESPAIVQCLADQEPTSGLAPRAGTLERYRLQEWLNFISAETHKNFSLLFNPAAAPEWKTGAIDNLKHRLGCLNKQLTGRSSLMCKQFTVADAYLFTVPSSSGIVGLDLTPWPTVGAYREQVRSRPQVQAAMLAEGLA